MKEITLEPNKNYKDYKDYKDYYGRDNWLSKSLMDSLGIEKVIQPIIMNVTEPTPIPCGDQVCNFKNASLTMHNVVTDVSFFTKDNPLTRIACPYNNLIVSPIILNIPITYDAIYVANPIYLGNNPPSHPDVAYLH